MTSPQPLPQHRPQAELSTAGSVRESEVASLAAIAREEQARIYSGLVREHHSDHWPMPARVTDWERRRLIRAAREMTRGDTP